MMFKVVATLLLALAVADANQKCDRVRGRLAALATDCSNDCPNISDEDRDLVTAAEVSAHGIGIDSNSAYTYTVRRPLGRDVLLCFLLDGLVANWAAQ